MNDSNLTLPFVIRTKNEVENLTYPSEVAYISCLAELSRKKSNFLRDAPEKLSLIAKIYYPLWIVTAENKCLVLDGLGLIYHKFSFREPTKIGLFLEEIKKNSVNNEQFMEVLGKQTKEISEFTESADFEFPALVADKELLTFFVEYFKLGSIDENENISKSLVPMEIDGKVAAEIGKTVTDCIKIIKANSKGLQYALIILKELTDFLKHATANDIERLKEKCENEIANLKPEVDKRVERLSQKHHKTLTSTQRIMERKVGALEKKREQYVRKLQSAEKRKEALQERRERIRRKKISSKTTRGFYELDSCEREINNIKKDVKSFSAAIDKVKKEGINNVKRIEAEFSKAVANEEEKIKNLNATFEVKINNKKQQIAEITKQVTAITNDFENIKDELEHSSSILRHQIEIGCKLDTPEKPLCCFLPIYMVKYVKASEERYAMFSPITISEDVSVLNGLRKIITFSSEPKFKALTRSVSKRLQDMLTFNVVDRMQSDVEFRSRVNSLCRANNLLDTMEFAETLNSGLDEFIKRNWITSEEAVSLCKRIMGEGV